MAVPTVAVRGGFMPARYDFRRDLRSSLDCSPAHIKCRLAVAAIEEIEDPPYPGTEPILVKLLHCEIAHPVRQRRDELAKLVIARLAVLQGGLRSFLEIDDEGHRQLGLVRPRHLGTLPTIANEIPAPISVDVVCHVPLHSHLASAMHRQAEGDRFADNVDCTPERHPARSRPARSAPARRHLV